MHTFYTRCSFPLAEEPAKRPVAQDSGEKRPGSLIPSQWQGDQMHFHKHASLKERSI